MPIPRRRPTAFVALLATIGFGCGRIKPTDPHPPSGSHVIEIDIDDHGLAGLWMAQAPNLKGLIARGTFAFSRVLVPTHSNHNNISLLSGQYPDADNVPANSWLSRPLGFIEPVNLPGISVGDYAVYTKNPLLIRGDSVYRAATRVASGTTAPAPITSAYFGQLPPFEAGADQVHLTIVGAKFGPLTVTPDLGHAILTESLGYPTEVVDRYHFDGPAKTGESYAHFTLRQAAAFIRSTSADRPMPGFMFVWDFLAIDDDPTAVSGADGPNLIAAVEDYDSAVGELLSALDQMHLLASTNIVFTLDHGKVDTHNQVVLGTRGGGGTVPADGQLADLVASAGGALGISTADYALLNEDGDAQVYARVPDAGTARGAARQIEVTHALLSLIQSGNLTGVDTSRTMTADGAMGTRRFQDFRAGGPNQADILLFPLPDWTLNQVDATNTVPGPFRQHTSFPYGRHGGLSPDELYVPLIMAGPSFKPGALIPHPVEHPQVPCTALWTLGETRLNTAARGPIAAAFVDDPGETLALADPGPNTRDTVLAASGYTGNPALAAQAAASVIIIDVGGLYEDEVFADPVLADVAQPLRDLATRGTRFEDFWTQSRDWPVTEYTFLAGGLPTSTAEVATAEDDPAQVASPGFGLLQMPPVPGFVANRSAFEVWRRPGTTFAHQTLLDAAKARGMTTAIVGEPDFHLLHIDPTSVDTQRSVGAPAEIAAQVANLLAEHAPVLALVTVGHARTGDRHAPAAEAELGDIVAMIGQVVAAAGDSLIIVTSRGATEIDDPRADFYGPGTSRHVPFLMLGPNVRVGVVSGQPGSPADVPATVLMGLGVRTTSDFVNGTWAVGTPIAGISQPLPSDSTAGHALVRAFTFSP